MHLTPKEIDKLLLLSLGAIAERRKQKGLKLNHPEAVAYITSAALEGAREGKTVEEAMALEEIEGVFEIVENSVHEYSTQYPAGQIIKQDPEGEKVKIWDMLGQSSGSGNGSYTLTKGTGRFLVRADKGEYEVGIGITDLGEENVLYLDELPSQEELDKLPPLG